MIRGSCLAAMLLLAGCTAASPSASNSQPTATPSPTLAASPTPIPIDEAMLARRFTVLVTGIDSNASRRAAGVGINTDALMVVSVSPGQSRINVMSLPRDTVDIPMPDGSIYHGKINGIYEKLGIEALRGALSTLLGVPIDHYILVDMDDFRWMVDAVGGVDVDVKAPLSDAHVNLHLAAGPAHLDGATALAYCRTRVDSDYRRAARQQQVMLALVRKWLDPSEATMVGSIATLASLKTDMGLDLLPTLLEMGRRAESAAVTTIVLEPPRFSRFVGIEPNTARGWVMIPDVPAIRAYVQAQLGD